jgi:hypothetical protein
MLRCEGRLTSTSSQGKGAVSTIAVLHSYRPHKAPQAGLEFCLSNTSEPLSLHLIQMIQRWCGVRPKLPSSPWSLLLMCGKWAHKQCWDFVEYSNSRMHKLGTKQRHADYQYLIVYIQFYLARPYQYTIRRCPLPLYAYILRMSKHFGRQRTACKSGE